MRSLALDALRRHWRVIFGRTPPADLSKDLLGRMIAYRLQERAFGGLDRESLRFLDGLARHGGSPRRRLKPGTVLVRDYQGQRHTVTVVTDGFDWQGATYQSLFIRCTRCGNIIDPMPVSIVQVSTPSFWSVLLSSRFWAAPKSSSKTRIVCVARYARNLST